MFTILVILLVLIVLFGGARNYDRHGSIAFGPLGLLLAVLIIIWLTGAADF